MGAPRNLLKGWCSVGCSFPEGLRAFGDDSRIQSLDARLKSLTGLRSGEPGAAWVLAAHTGLWPEPRDGAEAGQRLVDFVLQGDCGYLEVAEVMQTTDAEFIRRLRTMIDRIVPAVHAAYNGAHSWGLGFERFVELPSSQRDLQQRASAWAEVLANADPKAGAVELGPGLSAWPFSDERPPGVYFSSANAEIAEPPRRPTWSGSPSTSQLTATSLDTSRSCEQRARRSLLAGAICIFPSPRTARTVTCSRCRRACSPEARSRQLRVSPTSGLRTGSTYSTGRPRQAGSITPIPTSVPRALARTSPGRTRNGPTRADLTCVAGPR